MNPQFFATIARQPKFIEPHSFQCLANMIGSATKPQAEMPALRPAMEMVAGVPVIAIHGPLLSGTPSWIKGLIGVTDYEDIERDIDAALASGARAIAFDINSPGGLAYPCNALANRIASLDVPTMGYVSGMACSAAYYLAAGMDSLSAKSGAVVGNIGTILTYADASKAMERAGVTFHALTNEGADLKSTFHLPSITPEQEQFLQSEIDDLGAEFRAFVEGNRAGINPEVFRAGWYHGEKALALGLIDEII